MLVDLEPEPTRWSPGACAFARRRRRSPAIQAEPAFLKGWSRCRTRARQLAALLAGARARRAGARPLRRRRRQDAGDRRRDGRTRARSIATDATSAASRRSTTGWSAPARATCRCARRIGRATCSTISRADGPRADRRAVHRHRHLAAQSGRQMAHAAGRARAAQKEQAEVLDRAVPLSSPAAGSSMSPARCSRRRTTTRCAPSSAGTRNFPSSRRPTSRGARRARAGVRPRPAAHRGWLLMTPRSAETDGFFIALLRRAASAQSAELTLVIGKNPVCAAFPAQNPPR